MISIPFGKTVQFLDVPDVNLQGVYTSRINSFPVPENQDQPVLEALEHPIGSPKLSEMATRARTCCIIISDHTRPVPSRFILPHMLRQLRQGNPQLDITLLVATGTHRPSTKDELMFKLGNEIVNREHIVIHEARDGANMVSLGILPSGGELKINRIAAETDLLLAEGFIEPHFFAGFSGGRKSVLPGIADYGSVLANHCGQFIASPKARTGKLEGNPIHEDMVWAARESKLAFIVNVVINAEKQIMKAFAGDPILAHQQGCDYLRDICHLEIPAVDIAITSNGGYPLDQNLYQSVKGMTAAEAATAPGGIIIIATQCGDGHGGEDFFNTMLNAPSPQQLYRRFVQTPQNQTMPEQWEAQIFARILSRNQLIMVTDTNFFPYLKKLHILHAETVQEALQIALKIKGSHATVAVIPDGVSVIVN